MTRRPYIPPSPSIPGLVRLVLFTVLGTFASSQAALWLVELYVAGG